MHAHPSPNALAAEPGREGSAARALAASARAGLYLHAALLPISIAGMQVGLGIAAVSLFGLVALDQRPFRRGPLTIPILALCGACVLSNLIAFSWAGGFLNVILWRSFLSPLVIVAALSLDPSRARSDALRLVAIWAVAAVLPSLVGWVQFFTGLDPLHELGLRATAITAEIKGYPGRYAAMGFFTWYQRLAQSFLPPLSLAAALLLLGRGTVARPRLAGLVLLVATSAVVMTFARTAWYGLAVAAAVIAFAAGPRIAAAAAAGGAALLALGVATNTGIRFRVLSTFTAQGNVDRIGIWNVCRVLWEEHPVRGWGFGNLPTAAKETWWRLYPVGTVRAWCHNQPFSSLVEGGPLLLAATLFYFGALTAAFWRWRRRTDALGGAACAGALAGIAAFALNALMHDVFYASEPMYGFGFMLGIAAVLAQGGETA